MALAIIFTSSSCTEGTPKLPGLGQQRFSDSLNMLDTEFIELTDASIQSLAGSGVADLLAVVLKPRDTCHRGIDRGLRTSRNTTVVACGTGEDRT